MAVRYFYNLRRNQFLRLAPVQAWLQEQRNLKPIGQQVHGCQLEADDWQALARWCQQPQTREQIKDFLKQESHAA